jgi:predicted ABC-type transport system involved in lysophospholipase L1 biosynthesis ATPase subunit
MALVELNQVRREFDGGRVVALHGISLSIEAGETLAIVGPSGSGKSTLLNLLCGLDHPSSGEVKFEGRPIIGRLDWRRIRAKHVGIVFQSFCLLPELTARENIEVAISGNLKDSLRRSRSLDLLDAVGLAERADHKPPRLSGGERQRVAIARALINQPRLVLADEPTGNLDQNTGRSVLDLLLGVVRSKGAAMVMITHEPTVASCCGRRIKIVDGRIVSDSDHA